MSGRWLVAGRPGRKPARPLNPSKPANLLFQYEILWHKLQRCNFTVDFAAVPGGNIGNDYRVFRFARTTPDLARNVRRECGDIHVIKIICVEFENSVAGPDLKRNPSGVAFQTQEHALDPRFPFVRFSQSLRQHRGRIQISGRTGFARLSISGSADELWRSVAA